MAIEQVREFVFSWLSDSVRSEDNQVGFVSELNTTLGSTCGYKREENEDRVLVTRYIPPKNHGREFCLLMLCDGMGGGTDGARCAELAIATIVQQMITDDNKYDLGSRLYYAVLVANDYVNAIYKTRGGTTLSALVSSPGGKLYGVNVGDSRIYRIRHMNGYSSLEQLSEDDTVAGELAKLRGERLQDIDKEYFSNYLAQYVGMGADIEPRIYDESSESEGCGYILTSDGTHYLPDAVFARLVQHAGNGRDLVRRMLTLSLWQGGIDNASILYSAKNLPGSIKKTVSQDDAIVKCWTGTKSLSWFVPRRVVVPVAAPDEKEGEPALTEESNQHRAVEKGAMAQEKKGGHKKAVKKKKKKRKSRQNELRIELDPEPGRSGNEGGHNGSEEPT